MKLHENQCKLLRHLARFNLLDYPTCLQILDTEQTKDMRRLSYAFRPLTKNGYLSRRKDGSVAILAKGRRLFPEENTMLHTGGGSKEIRRVIEVSRMAALMERNGIPCYGELMDCDSPYFIPSACWRRLAPGILSTTRFMGVLMMGGRRLAVYDIGDGGMEWQLRAESSLFYTRYGSYETKATGMLFVCQEELRDKIAANIIRQTMWNRRQLIDQNSYAERNRPVRWSNAPIRLRTQYECVYLTTPATFWESIHAISGEAALIEDIAGQGGPLHDPVQGDCETWPYRYFINPASDLLKYVYFFSAALSLLSLRGKDPPVSTELNYAIVLPRRDYPILRLYQTVLNMEGLKFYEYRPAKDD